MSIRPVRLLYRLAGPSLAVAFLCSGCGQTGPLYLPPPRHKPAPPASSPAPRTAPAPATR